MTDARWARVKTIFNEAVARPVSERAAFVSAACADDPDLRAEVERLLASDAGASGFMEAPPFTEMRLTPGSRLGPYEVVSVLGSGGMGEVYRARDTQLGRDVALKTLPALFAADPDRLARFAREAHVLASLNHPNIAGIYGLADSGGIPALVLELVEGPTLADRIARGPLTFDEAVPIAQQIADALDAAHQRGIIHRDLKPANIKVRPDGAVKILDFGLAKALDPIAAASAGATDSPTITSPAVTRAGIILGTAAYMSPEQARGAAADKRADIWAFGVVLFEMLTGRRLFEGETVSDTLAAVLKDEPQWPDAPGRARTLLKRCLEKDPKLRLRDIGDAMPLIADGPSPEPASPRTWWLWAPLAAVFLAAIGISMSRFGQKPPVNHLVRFQIKPPTQSGFDNFAVSPDGSALAFFSGGQLWIHSLASDQSRLVSPDSIPASLPFWSPDSRSIAFYDRTHGKIRAIDVSGSGSRAVCDVPPAGYPFGGGSWSQRGIILFSSSVIKSVPAAGGVPTPVTVLDASHHEVGHFTPAFLPDGDHFVYYRGSLEPDRGGIYVGSLTAKPEAQDETRLVAAQSSRVAFVQSNDSRAGFLLFRRDDQLVAQPFDAGRRQLTGEAIPVAEAIDAGVGAMRLGAFSAAESGVVVFREPEAWSGTPVWVDRHGRELSALVAAPLDRVINPRLSPDGQRLALIVAGDLWVYDLSGKPPRKVTFTGHNDVPLWSPDGQEIFYSSGLPFELMVVRADGTSAPERLMAGHRHPLGWSSDGGELMEVETTYTESKWDIFRLRPRDSAPPHPVVQTSAAEGIGGAALSHDGNWLAYTSNVTGSIEVWVQPYPGPGAAIRVSPNTGVEPQWSGDGRELYYIERGRMMAVPVETENGFRFKPPTVLFESRFLQGPDVVSPPSYDVASDGRFILIKSDSTPRNPVPITVLLNWIESLRALPGVQ